MKKALIALALLLPMMGASYAQSTAAQVSPGGLYNAPQTNCPTGPCFLQGPYHPQVITGSQTNIDISSSTALTIPTGANIALIEFQGTANSSGGCARYRDDGTAPTTSVGIQLSCGVPYEYDTLSMPAKFIQDNGATTTMTVFYYK